MRKIDKIIIHCSDTPYFREYHASDIDKWHKDRGFTCIGYHYVITLDGTIEFGRPLFQVGAHCKGYNSNSIGICYIGGRSASGQCTDTRTPAQVESMHNLVDLLLAKFPNATVHGHNEFSNKVCPCFNVSKETWRS